MKIANDVTTYTTKDGDNLGAIAARFYAGNLHGTIEWLLEHNPHLLDLGFVFSAGVILIVPRFKQKNEAIDDKGGLSLWD